MQAILALAQRLGKAVADSPQAKALREARKELDKDEVISKLLGEFRAQSEKVAKLEHEKKPVEVADKHNLQDLQGRLISDETFKKFTAAQVEYVDLMRNVNETLRKELSETEMQ